MYKIYIDQEWRLVSLSDLDEIVVDEAGLRVKYQGVWYFAEEIQ